MDEQRFKSESGKWVLVVNGNGFYLYDIANPNQVILDASTLFTHENAWIELLDEKRIYEFYTMIHSKGNNFGLRSK